MSKTEDKEIALVTGASRGIGRATAVALAESGRHVVINYLERQGDAEETLGIIESMDGSAELVGFDVTDGERAPTAVGELVEKHGRIDILVNNAGILRDMLMAWMQLSDWQSVVDVKLRGFYLVTKPVVKSMLGQRRGRIINIASTSGLCGLSGQVHYSAANAGLIGATRALSREVARRGITVNAIAPGFIETDMLEKMDEATLVKDIPVQRLGRPEEVAALVVFLCDPKAAYITGQVIGVNGGIY